MQAFDIIIVGAGHAGVEAALAASRIGCHTALVTLNKDTIGLMSCNPAIGGVGKGQLVKEIDALGGEMAEAADTCAIQFRRLNASKGPAVQSTRCQVDRRMYQRYIAKKVAAQENLCLIEEEAVGLITKDAAVLGIQTSRQALYSKCVILACGTFLGGVVYFGLEKYPAGRRNEPASIKLSQNLRSLGLHLSRLKTCTPPRLDGKSIDFSRMSPQPGDSEFRPFSFSRPHLPLLQQPCYLTYTNPRTHAVIRSALRDKKLLLAISQGTNPRYCPSIEEKIIRFSDKQRHQLFIEPEGRDTDEYYVNGLFTFLPREIQEKILATICGLENSQITHPGYGVEYDFIIPTQLLPTLEVKAIKNLFLAGQINGTTGYEEAAAQGLIAGINAGLKVKQKPPLILDRSTSYTGVLIDDLVTKGTLEPYRMFTSRVEYRLLIREDNADLRLARFGYLAGLISKQGYAGILKKQESIEQGIKYFKETRVSDNGRKISLFQYLRRPQIKIRDLSPDLPLITEDALGVIEAEIKYSGYIQRQVSEVKNFRHLEKIKIPENLDYAKIPGLSNEIKEKLSKQQLLNLGQVNRISGITPAAITLLMVWLRRKQADAP